MILNNYIIRDTASVVDALIALNNQSGDAMTLFVVNEIGQMVGTLTDGDIRRALIINGDINTSVSLCMNYDFFFLEEECITIDKFPNLRERGISLIPILDKSKHIIDAINLRKEKSRLPIDAVLMAGGKGERLRPLTESVPKPLLKVGDKCIIDYNILSLISYGVKNISVTVNYLAGQLEEHFSEPICDVRVKTVREPKFLGTIGSIRFVENFYNDAVLVMNSDLFTNIDYEDFYLHFKEHNADMSVAAVPYSVSIPFGVFDLNGRNIRGLLEKPKYNYYANAGIYLMKRNVLTEIPKDTFFNATDLIEALIAKGKTVVRYPLNGTWIDIGTPQEFQKAQELAKHIQRG